MGDFWGQVSWVGVGDRFLMPELTRHFTATTLIVHEGKVLLHLHPKQGLWLPPGGHIERDELPHVAARREVEEETGLRIRLHSEAQAAEMSRAMGCEVVPQPAFILVENIDMTRGPDGIEVPAHQHIDFHYLARLEAGAPALPPTAQENGFVWLAPDELDRAGVPQNVKVGADRAIRYFQRLAEPAGALAEAGQP